MHTQQIIAAHPDVREMVNKTLIGAIDEMYACAQACTSCADGCLAEQRVAELRQCIRLNLDAHTSGGARSRVVASHRLPRLDGGQLQVTLVQVTYAPGESSHPHSHPCPVVGYVLDGAVRMRVGDMPEVISEAGEEFYEPPNAHHVISANARPDAPARFLAVLTCDHDEPLSKPIRHTRR